MRACAVILIFSALPCFIHSEPRAPRKIYNSKKENLRHLVSCVESLGLSKCVSAFGLWRAENALGDLERKRELEIFFPWKNYSNLTDEELNSKLNYDTGRLLRRTPLMMSIGDSHSLQLRVSQNGSINIDVLKSDENASGRGSMKNMQKMITKMLPLLLVPGLIMSAVLPFFLPTLKMMTMAAVMINNMALTGAVFTLLRNNAFNDGYKKKVIYINAGYKHDHRPPPIEDVTSEVIEDPYGSKFSGLETHDFRDYHLFDNSQYLGSPTQFSNPMWLKPDYQLPVRNVEIVKDSNELKWSKNDILNNINIRAILKNHPKTKFEA